MITSLIGLRGNSPHAGGRGGVVDIRRPQCDDTSKKVGQTLGLHTYNALRDRMATGEWLPGTKLTLRTLASQLGTSVQPVREAIGKLIAERILILRPNHSILVPPVDRPLMDEVFSMRNMLEAEAVKRAVSNLSDEDINYIETCINSTRKNYTQTSAVREIISETRNISLLIANKSESSILFEQISLLRARTAPFYAAAMSLDHSNEKDFILFTTRIQKEFLFSLRKRDSSDAAAIRHVDLYTFQHYIYRMLSL